MSAGKVCQCSTSWGLCCRPAVARRYVLTRGGHGGQWRYLCQSCAVGMLKRDPKARIVKLPPR